VVETPNATNKGIQLKPVDIFVDFVMCYLFREFCDHERINFETLINPNEKALDFLDLGNRGKAAVLLFGTTPSLMHSKLVSKDVVICTLAGMYWSEVKLLFR
jgi:hypothetical protein